MYQRRATGVKLCKTLGKESERIQRVDQSFWTSVFTVTVDLVRCYSAKD